MPYDARRDFRTIRVKPLNPAIGAEIHGVVLSAPLTGETVAEIHDALMAHQVVFFRDQSLTPKQQATFARHFGEVPAAQRASFGVDEAAPEISVLEYDQERPPNVNHYHTDGIFRQRPQFASLLYAVDVPETGGDTIWVSMYAAWDGLSDRMRRYLDGLTAVNDFMHLHGRPSKARSWKGDGFEGMEKARRDNPPVPHPLVRTHPVTGRKGLYFSESFTTRILDLPEAESKAALEFLARHVMLPEFQVRFRWEKGSMAFWDNRCTQHYAVADYWPQHRLMHRATIRLDETPV